MSIPDATQRFTSRVDNYARYRPGYPPEVLQLLQGACNLTPEMVIADIASGTGIFTKILLENGNEVFGVEPNTKMRQAGEAFLADYPRFRSIAATAEATTLPDASVHMVTAAQAAHWFDFAQARREFIRILRPGGWCVLLWNERQLDATPFLQAYERLLLDYGSDYRQVRHELTTARIHEFFAPSPFHSKTFVTQQEFDYLALEGRLLSSSYAPQQGDPNFQPMLNELNQIFDVHQNSGKIAFHYDTKVFFGKLT